MILDLIKGKGTTFEVRLPITKKVVNENEKKDKVENKNLQLVGLIIDDEPGMSGIELLTKLRNEFPNNYPSSFLLPLSIDNLAY